MNPRTKRFEVVQPGISISSRHSTNGTLGLIVKDKLNNDQPCILSNWHILAKKKTLFFTGSYRPDSPIFQPGRIFDGRSYPPIAKLVRYDKSVDAAIAKLTVASFLKDQFESGKRIMGLKFPKEGDIVEKSGVRTGVTQGEIKLVRGNKVQIRPLDLDRDEDYEISDGGDSGCIWYDPKTGEGVVLHSAGEKKSGIKNEFASGYVLQTVMKRLNIGL